MNGVSGVDGVDFAVIFDALPVPTAVLAPDGMFLAVNRAYEAASGRARGTLIGEDVCERFPGGTADQGAAMLRVSLEKVVAEHRVDVLPLLRYDVESPGGVVEERYWSLMNAPVLGTRGRVRYIVHRVEEATEFVRRVREHGGPLPAGAHGLSLAEARLQIVEADLFARTAELQADNLRLNGARRRETRDAARLRREVERQRNAVADTSHDLRGPITGLQTRLQDALADPRADAQDILRAALLDAERLGDIVADLLELARLDSGTPAVTEPVRLAAIVRESLDRRVHAEPPVGTRLDEDVVVSGSALRLTRLVDNLLANAARHARSAIDVEVTAEAGHAVLRVRDDGPGIPEPDREAVFERFFRRSDARRADPAGTGLGLAISREIARSHGGTLHIADTPGGAHLVLRIPLAPGPAG